MTLSAEQITALSDAEFGQHVDLLLTDASLVRHNMMHRIGYAPYCGQDHCMGRCPFDAKVGQFVCARCRWKTALDADFIAAYKRQQTLLIARKKGVPTLVDFSVRELDAEEAAMLKTTVLGEASQTPIDYSLKGVKAADGNLIHILTHFRPDIHVSPYCRLLILYLAHGNASRAGMLLFTAVKKCGLTNIRVSDFIERCFPTGIPTEAAYSDMWKAVKTPSQNLLENKENWT